MGGPPYPKTLLPLPPFSSMKSSSSSPPILFSSKLNIIQSFILSQIYRVARALAKGKTLLIQVVKNFQAVHIIQLSMKKNNTNKNKLFVGSFRLHYNWSSSRIKPVQVPVPVPVPIMGAYSYDGMCHDSAWNTLLSNAGEKNKGDDQESQLSGYLNWLEQKTGHDEEPTIDPVSEIDRLADIFIASCHEKFRLEKIDSYRRFQEMMARSI